MHVQAITNDESYEGVMEEESTGIIEQKSSDRSGRETLRDCGLRAP